MANTEDKTDVLSRNIKKDKKKNCLTMFGGCCFIFILAAILNAIMLRLPTKPIPETVKQEPVKQETVKPEVKPSKPAEKKIPLKPVKPSDPRIALLDRAGEETYTIAYDRIGGLIGTVITAEDGGKIYIYVITEPQLNKEESMDILDAVIRLYPYIVKGCGGDWFDEGKAEDEYYSDLYDPYRVEVGIQQIDKGRKNEIYKQVKPKGEPFKPLPCSHRTLDYGL